MLFNSLNYLIFLPVVLILFYLLPVRFRWMMLLAASCIFYMAFIPVYILILFVTIIIDYFAGIWIEKSEGKKKKFYLIASIISTCLVLFVFKYFNFFNSNFQAIADLFHWNYPVQHLDIILPIGLSFHTFQSLSYVIEVYRGHQKAEKHFGIYSLYVMFFPQLVAGPIERPENLLVQLKDLRNRLTSNKAITAIHLIALGFFKKLVIADRLAIYVGQVYEFPEGLSGLNIAIATFFFAMQIYCDFSGYSDIAIGSAALLGVKLMENFRSPYFSRSISEFWSRWHISLSSWFRDYVYIPLGGNRVNRSRWYFNLFIVFMISGLWHGANWTFVVWGMLHGFYLIFSIAITPLVHPINKKVFSRVPRLKAFIDTLVTFVLVCIAWVFFRAENINDAFLMVSKIFNCASDIATFKVTFYDFTLFTMMLSILAILFLFIYESIYYQYIHLNYRAIQVSTCVLFTLLMLIGIMGSKNFIYFQF